MVLELVGILVAIVLIALALHIVFNLKSYLVNAVLGVIALLIINYLGKEYGVQIPITIVTVLVSAVLGLAGVGALIILKLLGIVIA